jgi:hypothetical protein
MASRTIGVRLQTAAGTHFFAIKSRKLRLNKHVFETLETRVMQYV